MRTRCVGALDSQRLPRDEEKPNAPTKSKSQRRNARPLKSKRPEPFQAIVKAQQQTQIVSIPEAIEKVLILGDLSSLTPQDRVDYYKARLRLSGTQSAYDAVQLHPVQGV